MKKMKTVVPLAAMMMLSAVTALSQEAGAEIRLMRENARLREKVDSLERLVADLTEMDVIWAGLSGMDDDNSSWGSGVSSLDELSLSEADRVIASRLGEVFPGMDIPYSPAVRERILSYGRPRNAALLGNSFRRLRRRMAYFKEVFRSYGVPVEIIPLCVVESAVSTGAVSPAGAAGMWQLMPRTAERYGLRVDADIDERFSLEKSTDAAARHLRDLKKTLGTWPLAVMAYNCGAARVRKAVMDSGTTDPWEVWKDVPKETKAYLPSLIAVGYLLEYGEEHGIR